RQPRSTLLRRTRCKAATRATRRGTQQPQRQARRDARTATRRAEIGTASAPPSRANARDGAPVAPRPSLPRPASVQGSPRSSEREHPTEGRKRLFHPPEPRSDGVPLERQRLGLVAIAFGERLEVDDLTHSPLVQMQFGHPHYARAFLDCLPNGGMRKNRVEPIGLAAPDRPFVQYQKRARRGRSRADVYEGGDVANVGGEEHHLRYVKAERRIAFGKVRAFRIDFSDEAQRPG